MDKRWSKAEVAHLRRFAGTKSLEELAQRLKADQATVQKKLQELGLVLVDTTQSEADQFIGAFEEGLELLYQQRWQEASERFGKIEKNLDEGQIRDRAAQYLAVCRNRLADQVEIDPYLAAVVAKNAGRYEKALEVCQEHRPPEEDERFSYLMASIEALLGNTSAALDHLSTAVRLEPKNRIHAYHDPDFEGLRGQEPFQELISTP